MMRAGVNSACGSRVFLTAALGNSELPTPNFGLKSGPWVIAGTEPSPDSNRQRALAGRSSRHMYRARREHQ